jgi:hypothetical protein
MNRARVVASVMLLLLAGLLAVASHLSAQVPPLLRPPRAQAPPEQLNQVEPQISVDRGTVYWMWTDEWAELGRHVRLNVSRDGGKTWQKEPLRLDREKPGGARSASPHLAHDGAGRTYVVFRTKYTSGTKDVIVAGSSDGGATWSEAPEPLNRGGGAFDPQVAADGQGRVYVVWFDEREKDGGKPARSPLEVYFNRSEDFGKTWLPTDVLLSSASDTTARGARRRISVQPRIAIDGRGRVFVIWIDNRFGPTEVFFRASEDSGKTWGPEVNVSKGATAATSHQILVNEAGRVLVVWEDSRHGGPEIFFNRSEDGGKSWFPEAVRVSRHLPAGVSRSSDPSAALGPQDQVFVAWQDRRNGREDIYFNRSLDGGKTWMEQDLRLDRDDAGTGVSRLPRVATDARGVVAVVWEDDRDGFEQILVNYSTDGGKTWAPREIRVDPPTNAKLQSKAPKAAWDASGGLHVVWENWKGEVPTAAEKRVQYRKISLP